MRSPVEAPLEPVALRVLATSMIFSICQGKILMVISLKCLRRAHVSAVCVHLAARSRRLVQGRACFSRDLRSPGQAEHRAMLITQTERAFFFGVRFCFESFAFYFLL